MVINRLNYLVLLLALICIAIFLCIHLSSLRLVVYDEKIEINEDSKTKITLRSNQTVFKGLKYIVIKQPQGGRLKGQMPHLTYVTKADFYGNDEIRFYIMKGNRKSNIGTITIKVKPENDPPVAQGKQINVLEDEKVKISLDAFDKENDVLQYKITKRPKHGRIYGDPPFIEYYPEQDYYGLDKLRFLVKDKTFTSEPAEVTINILPVNDIPIAISQKTSTFENIPLDITLVSDDKDGDILNYTLIKRPTFGRLKGQESTFKYLPDKNFVGIDKIYFKVSDGVSESGKGILSINVKAIKNSRDFRTVLRKIIKKGGVAIGSYNKPDHIYRAGHYIPASITKITTAAASLKILGENYRFHTNFYLDKNRNLYIKGFGDPSLTSKEWHTIAEKLYEKGILDEPLNDIVLDETVFSYDLEFDGRRNSIHYFDAPPGALVSNYNTIVVKISGPGQIRVLNEYTPITPMIKKRVFGLPKGIQHFNVVATPSESAKYSGELARAIFKEHGASFNGFIKKGQVPSGTTSCLVHYSTPKLKDVIKKMLKESNNFIANQLLLAMAYERFGGGVGIEHGVELISSFLHNEIGLKDCDFNLVEGSGLSKKNRVDLLAMLKIVNYFADYRDLLPSLRSSKYEDLARMGRKWDILAKSGTLNKVSTLAGFIKLKNNSWKPFVIMLDQEWSKRGKVMEVIGKYYNG